ncbi:uncharacterized protein BDW47DRAFT_103268 [Aspergillus candidus]|uniref:Uncharacterized protein n=1 Tax=Aspergillus candidus TaxID=41067 RepID=A0A2I2FFZ2_ASPCN|nr:hypothetical protein BDW47DRAFT_103268 [Aspergillus candidus]PLB39556.1 hypothetical protein BDW47DRAFT_103268 [Aspergillus candidus]
MIKSTNHPRSIDSLGSPGIIQVNQTTKTTSSSCHSLSSTTQSLSPTSSSSPPRSFHWFILYIILVLSHPFYLLFFSSLFPLPSLSLPCWGLFDSLTLYQHIRLSRFYTKTRRINFPATD